MSSSLVLELQRDALDTNVTVSALLRKTLVIAVKLSIRELESWARKELGGYENAEEIPAYRHIRGEPRAFNPYRGWQTIHFPTEEIHNLVATKPCDQSVVELETVLSRGDDDNLVMPFTAEQAANIRRAIQFDLEVTLFVQIATVAGILEAVRNAILEWSLRLEQDGIRGEGLTFTIEERTMAQRATCFISFTDADDAFAERLYKDLRAAGVRCWRWKEDARWGRALMGEVDQAIRAHDKLIVVCSQQSLAAEPVVREIERALQREQRDGTDVLFPIRLDEAIFSWDHALQADLVRKYVGDFRGWKDPVAYHGSLERLLRDLRLPDVHDE
jgi:hypothetical protein